MGKESDGILVGTRTWLSFVCPFYFWRRRSEWNDVFTSYETWIHLKIDITPFLILLPSTLLRPLFSEHIPLDNLNITMASVAYDLLHKVAPVVAEQFIFQNASTTQNELYGDLNMDHLNWLERQWAAYYIWMGNALLATGVMSFVMHEVSPT